VFLRIAYNKWYSTDRWSRITTRYISRVCAMACTVSLCVGAALAQQPATPPLLRGMVVDPQRAPLVAALVTVMDSAKQTVVEAHTDSAGEFALHGLSPGVLYLVTVRQPGFMTMETRATLRPTDTLDLDVLLATDTITTWTPTSARPRLSGTVVDSLRVPLAAASVTAVDSATNKVVFEVHTDSAGRFTFDHLSVGVPYLIIVRRVGSIEGTSRATLRPGYTLTMKFVLVTTPRLAPVRITAKADREYHDINAAEIAQANVPLLDSYDIVLRLRPFLLGNPYKGCMRDTSQFTFGPPRPTTDTGVIIMQDPRKFTLGVGSWAAQLFKNGGWQVHRKTAGGSSLDAPPADSAYPFHLYINGILRVEPGAKNILSQIPIDDIQEMHYIDCLDTTMPPQYRNSLMISLKPGKSY